VPNARLPNRKADRHRKISGKIRGTRKSGRDHAVGALLLCAMPPKSIERRKNHARRCGRQTSPKNSGSREREKETLAQSTPVASVVSSTAMRLPPRFSNERALAFDRFVLFPKKQLLLESGKPVQLGTRALDILTLLVERAGDLVTKEELVAHACRLSCRQPGREIAGFGRNRC
jgi:hypothetical protein